MCGFMHSPLSTFCHVTLKVTRVLCLPYVPFVVMLCTQSMFHILVFDLITLYVIIIYSTVGKSISDVYDPRRRIYQGARSYIEGMDQPTVLYKL